MIVIYAELKTTRRRPAGGKQALENLTAIHSLLTQLAVHCFKRIRQ